MVLHNYQFVTINNYCSCNGKGTLHSPQRYDIFQTLTFIMLSYLLERRSVCKYTSLFVPSSLNDQSLRNECHFVDQVIKINS